MDHYSNARVTPATPKAVAAITMLTAVLLSFIVALPSQAYAAITTYETTTLEDVQFYQTEARKELSYVNDFRTGDEAWYYSARDTSRDESKKIYCEGLSEVEWDYDLERMAMQRVAELAVCFSHTRPNGGAADPRLSREFGLTNITGLGENAGHGGTSSSGYSAFKLFKEDYQAGENQGHRRQMLKSGYKRFGAAIAKCQGSYYCVQLFTSSDAEDGDRTIDAVDTTMDMSIQIKPDYVTSITMNPSATALTLNNGSTTDLPSVTAGIKVQVNDYESGKSTVTVHPAWTSSDESVATVDAEAGTVTATGYGTATLTASSLGATADVTVSVTKDISGAYIDTIEDQTFDATEHKPALTITYDGEALTEGTDYTLSYANNRTPGIATVTVTGIGTYSGSTTREFTINKAQGSCEITDQVKDYDGKAYTLEPTTKPGGVNCTFEYFEDEACTNAISEAGAAQPGVYYVRATSAEHRNYTSATSNVAKLTIKGPASITMEDDGYDYDGTAKTYGGEVSIEGGTEVSYEYFADEACTQPISAPVNVGTYYVKGTLKGDELHTDATATAKLTIYRADLEDITVSEIAPRTYTGSAITPSVDVTLNGRTLTEGTDYTLSYEYNVNVNAAALVIVHGKGNYVGSIGFPFTIERATSTVSIEDLSKAYDGKAYTSTVKADPAGAAYTLKYFSDAACAYAITEGEAAQVGTCYVKAVIAETANYTGAESNVAKLTVNKAKSSVSAAAQSATYNGHAVDYTGKVTKSGSNESISITYYADAACTKQIATPVNAGTYYVKAELAGNSNYEPACAVAKLTINKASNTAKVSAAKKTVKYSKVKKKAQTVKPIKVSKAQGKVTYKKSSGSSKIKVAKNGKVTVKKGTKKGTYKVKVKVTAAGNGNYKAYTKTVTVTVKVK